MRTNYSVNHSEPGLTENKIPLEKVCRVDRRVPEVQSVDFSKFVNKSYIIEKSEDIQIHSPESAQTATIEYGHGETVSFSDFSATIWQDYLNTQYEKQSFKEGILDSARICFSNEFEILYKEFSKLFEDTYEQPRSTYFNASNDVFVFWHDDFSYVYDLKGLNSKISNILYQDLIESVQKQFGLEKGWYLDITRTRHSRAKWAYSLSQHNSLFCNGLKCILGIIQSLGLGVRIPRDTITTYLQRSIVKRFLKFKNGIRSVEDEQIGDKEQSDSKGQRLGISQTAYSRFVTGTR